MKDALEIHRALLEHQVHHEIVRLGGIILTADELPDVLGLPPHRCVAVRVYEIDNDLLAVIVRAGDAPPLSAIATATGARWVRPAPSPLVNEVTDFAAGLVSPILLPESLGVLIDSRLADSAGDDVVYTPTGDCGLALGIRVADLLLLCGAKGVDFAASESTGREPFADVRPWVAVSQPDGPADPED